jgi:hypothetical protein
MPVSNWSKCSVANSRATSSLCPVSAKELKRFVCGTTPAFTASFTRLPEAVYVLHAFQMKTQATSRHEIETARE